MIKFTALLFIVATCAFTSPRAHAVASCGLSLTVSNITLVWSTSLPTQQITFKVKKSKNAPCDYFVTFSKGGASDYNRRMLSGSNTLRYQIYKEAALTNILKELPEVTSDDEIITGSFGVGSDQTQTRTYFVQIPLNLATTPTLKPSGTYVNTFIMRVYRDNPANSLLENSKNVLIKTTIQKNVQLSLVNSGGAFNPSDTTQAVAFGTLTTGASRAFDMRVLTNAGYRVTFSSQNNGALKHALANVTTAVPYTLTINGLPKNLSSSKTVPIVVASGSGQTSVDGVGHAVEVIIGSVTDKMAGAYSDIITVTAATAE